MERLDVELCRGFFPQFDNGVTYLENAGGSYVPTTVLERLTGFVRECQCQPDWGFASSRDARQRLDASIATVADLAGSDRDEIVIGPSTTLNVYVLSHALRPLLADGDAIVVTDQDHEANGGAWRRWADTGIEVRVWSIDPETGELDPSALDTLLDERVKLVCFPHVSNVVGTVNPVAAITAKAHDAGALVCVDGVAYAAHAQIDVRAWDVDFYLFSLYKLYGPHLAVMYARREVLERLVNQNHFFHAGSLDKKLNPGGLAYESVASIAGIGDYLDRIHGDDGSGTRRERWASVFGRFRAHERDAVAPLLEFLKTDRRVRLIGAGEERMPTVSFSPNRKTPEQVAEALAQLGYAIGSSHFYAPRCVEGLGIDPSLGVARVSLVHYNTRAEVRAAVDALDAAL